MTSDPTGSTPTGPDAGATLRPVHPSMRRIVAAGMCVWAALLIVTLVVPALRTGERSWWPWCCVSGVGLGALGLAYLSRGRGNAAEA